MTDPENLFEQGRRLPLVEEFYTIQGEGFHTGKPAYFIRLGGCEAHCAWCDAKNTWDPNRYPPVETAAIVQRAIASGAQAVVLTGGEPLRYPLDALTGQLKQHGLEIYLETSGAYPMRGRFDWICLSPKIQLQPTDEAFRRADELKVIIQHAGDLVWAEQCALRVDAGCRLYLQPEWSVREQIVPTIVEYVKEHPCWSISLQTHKFMDIP